MFTPPLTPAHGHGTHSANSSVSGIPGASGRPRRDSESEREDISPKKKRDLQAVPEAEEGRQPKKRRIAPTPVTLPSVETNDSPAASTVEDTQSTEASTQQ